MTRVLRSAAKKIPNNENLSSKLTISKKSKTIKRRQKKSIEIKDEDKKQSDIWNINSILSNIFAYSDRKDLIKFSTVCKKWNNLTNSIIHKTIKLIRNRSIYGGDVKIEKTDKIDKDVKECISNNAKHAHLVKEFKYDYNLRPRRAVKVFETFRFISKLTIEGCDMKQDQFLSMISPLTQLQELTICNLTTEWAIKKPYKELVQLPPTLKKLRLKGIRLINNPELFIQVINSHSNLVEFSINSFRYNDYLSPFYKNYPSLLNFELISYEQQISQSLLMIFEHNPQLISLELKLFCWSSELMSHISNYLTNLECLKLSGSVYDSNDNSEFIVKFSQPTKIKKLSINKTRLSICSLDSILINCPNLEELDLNPFMYHQRSKLIRSLDLCNPGKLKKLTINCNNLDKGVFESILLKCPHINELRIKLPFEWKEAVNAIYEKCANLERLDISYIFRNYREERDTFYQEFYGSKFFIGSPKCMYTLTHLTLYGFEVRYSKTDCFKNFEKLKSVIYSKLESWSRSTL